MNDDAVKLISKRSELFVGKCTNSLMHHYWKKYGNDDAIDYLDYMTALKLFSQEMERIISYGYKEIYCITKRVLQLAEKHRLFAFASGNSAYSFAAFLYGITLENAVEYEYQPEIMFDLSMKKQPHFTIAVSDMEKMKECIVEEFGQNAVNIKQYGSNANVEIVSESFPPVYVGLRDEPFFKTIEQTFSGDEEDRLYEIWKRKVLSRHRLGPENIERSRGVLSAFYDSTECPDKNTTDKEKFLDTVCDGTLQGLTTAVAIIKGAGVWKANESIQGFNIFTRDNLYSYCLKATGGDNKIAFEIMHNGWRGKGVPEEYKAIFSTTFIQFCDHIKYIVAEGGCVPYANLLGYMSIYNI